MARARGAQLYICVSLGCKQATISQPNQSQHRFESDLSQCQYGRLIVPIISRAPVHSLALVSTVLILARYKQRFIILLASKTPVAHLFW